MSSNVPDPTPSRTGGLLARLKGMIQGTKPPEPTPSSPATPASSPPPEEVIPAWDSQVEAALGSAPTAPPSATEEAPGEPEEVPQAAPVEVNEEIAAVIPVTAPVAVPVAAPVAPPEGAPPLPAPPEETAQPPAATPVAEVVPEAPVAEPEAPATIECPVCGSTHNGKGQSCADCGYYFSPADLKRTRKDNTVDGNGDTRQDAPKEEGPAVILQGRFKLGAQVLERPGLVRFNGLDLGDGNGSPRPVSILRQEMPQLAAPVAEPVESNGEEDEIMPAFDFPSPAAEAQPAGPTWPSISWERKLLADVSLDAVPAVVAEFSEDLYEYLVEEVPTGQSLWDAWDDPDASSEKLYGLNNKLA
jgi:hypothetical protein